MANTGSEENNHASKLTKLARAEYTCPECNEVVVRIVGNNLEYLPSHVHAADSAGNDGFVSLVMGHPPRMGTNFVWPIIWEKPFLAIQSSEMRS